MPTAPDGLPPLPSGARIAPNGMPPLPSETTTSAPEVIEVETEVIEAVEVAESEAACAETSGTREGTTPPPEEKPEGGVPPEPPAPAEQGPPPIVEVHRQAAPPTPGPSTTEPIRKNHLPWVIAAVVVVIALVAGGSFWVLSSRASQARAAEMDTALNGLRSSISSAERSLERARSAVDALAEQEAAKDDTTVQALAAKADAAIIEFAETLDGAREMLSSAQAQGPTADAAVKVQEAAAALEDLAEQLDEVTGSVEDAVDELQAAPREMNLAQIAKGDYSSIEGTWVSANVPEDSNQWQRLEISGSTIKWEARESFWGTIRGLDFDGEDEGGLVEATESMVVMQWATDAGGGFSVGSLMAFYAPGAPFAPPFSVTDEVLPSDESVPRILGMPGNGIGRLWPPDLTKFVLVREEDVSQPAAEERTTEPAGCVAPVQGAYACAGGPIPADAHQLPGFIPAHAERPDEVASFATPSGNIWCSVEAKETICIVNSWDASTLPGYVEEQGGAAGVTLKDSGSANYSIHSGAPIGADRPSGTEKNTIPYGTVWYFGDFVFASEEAGLTFWNVTSGYGAMINRSGFYPFGPK